MTWLNRAHQFEPGAELFVSDRTFQLYDYTPSHSQLLLRSHGDETRVDILFKPVRVQKLLGWYDGLRIRCATAAEQERIRHETPAAKYDDDEFFFVLEKGSGFDYVVAMAVGWHEGPVLSEVTHFADPSMRDVPKWRQKALDGVDAGLGSPMATLEEFDAVLRDPADRDRYREIYVVTGHGGVVGGFLVRTEAEDRRRELAERFPDLEYTVQAVAIAY